MIHKLVGDEQTNLEATLRYLQELYSKDIDGDLVFCRPREEGGWTRLFIAQGKGCNLDKVARRVHGKSQVYLKINTMNGLSIASRGMNAIGGIGELVEIVGFFSDIDADKRDCYPTRSAALEMLKNSQFPPTMIVGSGGPSSGGLHAYRLLKEPLPVNAENLQRFQIVSQGLERYQDSELKKLCKDFRSDQLHGLERVLRVPGSIRKDGFPVALLEIYGPRYTIEDFESFLPPLETKQVDYSRTRINSDSDCPISQYLSISGRSFEDWVLEFGFRLVGNNGSQNLWQRPGAGPDASRVSAKQGVSEQGRPGIQNFSGSADIGLGWHNLESLFVHYKFNGDWTEAARWCHEQLDQICNASLPPVDLQALESQPVSTQLPTTAGELEQPGQEFVSSVTEQIEANQESVTCSVDDLISRAPRFIKSYVDYCAQTAHRQQPAFALAGAITLSGVLLGRKVCDPLDTRTNFYNCCVGVAGSGKDHPRKVNTRILTEAKAEQLIGSDQVTSETSIGRMLQGFPAKVMHTDEFGRWLSTSDANRNPMMYKIVSMFLKLWSDSNSRCWSPMGYADTSRNYTIDQPHVCLFGTTTPESFYASLGGSSIDDGLLSRLNVFIGDDLAPRQKPILLKPPAEIISFVEKWFNFNQGGNLAIEHPEPLVVPAGEDAELLYDAFAEYCDRQAFDNRAVASLWARAYQKARQFGLTYACCDSAACEEAKIDTPAAQWGIDLANLLTVDLAKIAETRLARSPFEAACQEVFRVIADEPERTMTKTALCRRIRKLKSKERNECINALLEQGRIAIEKSGFGTEQYRAL